MKYTKWVSTWGNAVSIGENRPESIGKNITLRYPVFFPFTGDAVKFTFDNFCGTEPIRIARATFYCNGNVSAILK